jgi:hypothetical protein
MVQKLWCSFLKTKMDREMKKYHEFEDAFQRIRTSTGNGDVEEMVTKFLTRESIYAQLLRAVNENETKLQQLRQENDSKAELLHNLKIENSNGGGTHENKAEGKEIMGLHEEIQQLEKEMQIVGNRRKNAHLVFD